MKEQGTQTSAFGAPAKINHNSAKFYNSRLYENFEPQKESLEIQIENSISEKNLNKIFCKSSVSMDELPDNSVHQMITSPPYNASKEYDENLSLKEYLDLKSFVPLSILPFCFKMFGMS